MYRVAPAPRLVVTGVLALVLLVLIAGTLSLRQSSAAHYAWSACGISAALIAVFVKRRMAARASEYIRIDEDAITAYRPAGFRVLPWAGVARLRVTRRVALELFDASGVNPIVIDRRFERFPELVADVLRHLAAAYETRNAGARRPPATDAVTFASSVLPEVSEVLGSLTFTASMAWWHPVGFILGFVSMPVTLRRLTRVPYAVTAGPVAVTFSTLVGSREIPTASVATVAFASDVRGRPAIVIGDVNGRRVGITISRLTERPLELYDLLRRLHDDTAVQTASPGVMPTRLAPMRAAAFIAASTFIGLAVASTPIFSGTVLRFAAASGYTRAATIVLRLGSPIDVRGPSRVTALYLAAWNGHLDIVKLLADRGASLDATDNEGFAPIHVAVHQANLPLITYLVSRGARLDARTKPEATRF